MRYHSVFIGVFLGLFLPACGETNSNSQGSTDTQTLAAKSEATMGLECPETGNLKSFMTETDERLIIVGELHGTVEAPALIEAMACHAILAGKKVSVGLELSDEDGRLDAFMESSGDSSAIPAFTAGTGWVREGRRDGRRSVAMFTLIDELRERKGEGHPLRVFGFDRSFDASPYLSEDGKSVMDANGYSQAREAAMAKAIQGELSGADLTIVLVGNIHGCEGRFERYDLNYRLMSDFLRDADPLRLLTTYASGEAWNCGPNGCGVSQSVGQLDESHPAFAITLEPISMSVCDYDGSVSLGPITASAPFTIDTLD